MWFSISLPVPGSQKAFPAHPCFVLIWTKFGCVWQYLAWRRTRLRYSMMTWRRTMMASSEFSWRRSSFNVFGKNNNQIPLRPCCCWLCEKSKVIWRLQVKSHLKVTSTSFLEISILEKYELPVSLSPLKTRDKNFTFLFLLSNSR